MNRTLVLVVLACGFSAAAHAVCPRADMNADCVVDIADLSLFAAQWLTTSEPAADLDANGYVDVVDLALFAREWRTAGCPILVNEILAHSHDTAPDWIELYNSSSVAVDIGRWWVSDNANDLYKYMIAEGTLIEPYGYFLLYETLHFGNAANPNTRTPFAFSENGENLFLWSDGNGAFPDCLIEQSFGASETAYSFGRYTTSTGAVAFPIMSKTTPGGPNAYPVVGPVVINEIMYHPAIDADAEYLELLNISSAPVTLFDYQTQEPWRFLDDAGISFSFPIDVPVTLEPREHLLLVRDIAAVGRYNLPADVQIFEWGTGRLGNAGDTLHLFKPGDVDDKGTRYWIEVDRIAYSDGSHDEAFSTGIDPWPFEADGLGPSLNRLFPHRYGDDPNNWQATIPTPGQAND